MTHSFTLCFLQVTAVSAKSCTTTQLCPQLHPAPQDLGALRQPLPSPALALRWSQLGPLELLSPHQLLPRPRSLWLTSSAGPKRPRVVPWRKLGCPQAWGPQVAAAAHPQSHQPQVGKWCPGTVLLLQRHLPPSLATSTTPSCTMCCGLGKGQNLRMVRGFPGTGSGMGQSQEDPWPAPTLFLPPQSLRMTRSPCPLW